MEVCDTLFFLCVCVCVCVCVGIFKVYVSERFYFTKGLEVVDMCTWCTVSHKVYALEVNCYNPILQLFNIVVDTEETAKDLLNKGRLKRRYTIIPLNKIAANALSSDVVKKAQALVSYLLA